jgi:RimJ/RimL family protein N-acetyltransferase
MMRMAIIADDFVPARAVPAIRLTGVDIRRINSLYGSDGGASFYAPDHIDTGIYRGVVVDGKLVSIAGTHVVSRYEGVAVVGNVYTHPRYRGRGYATVATSAVSEVLLEFCDTIVLTVDPLNTPAVRAYKQLGYVEVCRLIEANGVRRDPLGWATALRRWRSGLRGRRYGGELVSLKPRHRP